VVRRITLGFSCLATRALADLALWRDGWRHRRRLDGRHVGHVLGGEDVDVYVDEPFVPRPGGHFLLALRSRAVPAGACKLALPALRRAAKPSTARGGRESGTIGFYGPDAREPYARPTAFTRDDREGWRDVLPFLKALDGVYAVVLPDRHAAQTAAVATSPDFRIDDTCFTTATVNRDAAFPAHADGDNRRGTLSVASVIRSGDFGGGLIVFPRWGLGVPLRSRDVLIFNPFEPHGNTPMTRAGPCERISVIGYARANLVGRGTAAEEYERAKRRGPGEAPF
jgi:hypothetical protein